uniref:Uncharacterized protein n=1 Tax=Romanomermis culicivorax TaxID=13658 RepID=A0A915KW10_ROMCU
MKCISIEERPTGELSQISGVSSPVRYPSVIVKRSPTGIGLIDLEAVVINGAMLNEWSNFVGDMRQHLKNDS